MCERFENEEVLINQIKQGNAKAFRHLMRMYFKNLVGFAYQYINSSHTAKDTVQDVFANIWERRDTWNPNKSLKTYLYQSVKNEALKHKRDRKIEKKYIEAFKEIQPPRKTPPVKIEEPKYFKKAVRRAIQELPNRARMAYNLHRRDGLTYKEIAEVMEISHRTVESQISRALKILRKELSSYLSILLFVIPFLQILQ